jgi:hypothetical protein
MFVSIMARSSSENANETNTGVHPSKPGVGVELSSAGDLSRKANVAKVKPAVTKLNTPANSTFYV